jgi:hypothetical protein
LKAGYKKILHRDGACPVFLAAGDAASRVSTGRFVVEEAKIVLGESFDN